MNPLKEQLKSCYLNRWDKFRNAMKNDPVFTSKNHPHLLSVTDKFAHEWEKSDLRIMVLGISTNGWGNKEFNIYNTKNSPAVEELMSLYEKFYFEGGNWRYGQVFWNYYYAIQELLKYRLKKNVQLIWNNVHKVDVLRQDLESKYFNVIQDEIKILQPDMILLLGMNCNNLLMSRISKKEIWWEKYEVWNDEGEERTFLYYKMPGEYCRELSSRLKHVLITYHPNARGDSAGIKMKFFIDSLVQLLEKRN